MKTNLVIVSVLTIGTSLFMNPLAYSRGHGGPREPRVKQPPEIVNWVGELTDDPSTHTTDHGHALRFVRQDDKSEFDVIDSPALLKLHHDTNKNYLVEIEAEKTPQYLFGGGNLIVKNFKVLSELGDAVPLAEPVRPVRREIMR